MNSPFGNSLEGRKSIEWSLKPIIWLTKICGIPAFCRSAEIKSSFIIQALRYCWFRIPILSCLLLHFFFHTYNFVSRLIIRFVCKKVNQDNWKFKYLPMIGGELFQIVVLFALQVGIPLVFTFKFFFTERCRFHNIWNSIRKIDEILQLPKSFYRKCRRRCHLLILIAFVVRTHTAPRYPRIILFLYFTPKIILPIFWWNLYNSIFFSILSFYSYRFDYFRMISFCLVFN